MRAGEVAWVAESNRGRGVSGIVIGSGCGVSKGNVRLIVRDGSAAAVVGRQRDGNRSV